MGSEIAVAHHLPGCARLPAKARQLTGGLAALPIATLCFVVPFVGVTVSSGHRSSQAVVWLDPLDARCVRADGA